MEPVLTPEEMRAQDAATILAGTPSVVLMDRAAFACASVALSRLGRAYGRRVVVVCGKGNNGGDGIAMAAHLARAGALVDAFLLDRPVGEAAMHLERARASGVRIREWSASPFASAARWCDLVVDAVFGTGLARPPQGSAHEAIEAIRSCGRPVLAVDIASGVSGADGSVAGATVRADVTVAIQALKVGHISGAGAALAGRVMVADIGIGTGASPVCLPSATDVQRLLHARALDAHKYSAGGAAILAGSPGMAGAAVLAARAAAAAGAGIVFLGVPRSCLEIVEASDVEAVKVPLADHDGHLGPKAVDEMRDRIDRSRALAVGPGLGRSSEATALLRRVVEERVPLVVDADGLFALADVLRADPDALLRRETTAVLTPHGGEFARLTGTRIEVHERLDAVRIASARLGAIVHLKGFRALTAAPDGTVFVNPTGGPGLATAGTGDVLTGVVVSFLAQGLAPAEATWAAAFVHGLAGDIATARLGERSVSATDVIGAIPRALAALRLARAPRGPLRTVLDGG